MSSFSRPKTYDPELATRVSNRDGMQLHDLADRIANQQRRSLKIELGLNSDDDDDDGLEFEEEEEKERKETIGYQELMQKYTCTVRHAEEVGERERRACEQVTKLRKMCKSQVRILRKGFQEKLKAQHETLVEMMQALKDCEEHMRKAHPEKLNFLKKVEESKKMVAEEGDVGRESEEKEEEREEEEESSSSTSMWKEKVATLENEINSLREKNRKIADMDGDEVKKKLVKVLKLAKASQRKLLERERELEELKSTPIPTPHRPKTPPTPAVVGKGKAVDTRKCLKILDELKEQKKTIKELRQSLLTQEGFHFDLEPLKKIVKNSGERQAMMAQKYEKEFKERRRLFNLVQELRGNIRVLCRVRPALQTFRGGQDEVVVRFPAEGNVELRNAKGREKTWEFDHVFAPNSTNQDVFKQVEDLCISILDGYNVCIFAYGQTGSGKTHTMEGPENDPGLNYRSLERLFDNIAKRKDGNEWNVEVQVSLLEIYNEQIRDLLNGKKKKLEIKGSPNGMTVPGLTLVNVMDHKQVLKLMNLGKKNRATASTDMNQDSSRSHSMLSVYVSAENTLTNQKTKGKLHLIDLAGSERVSKSNVEGQQFKEATNINKSLAALGDVIQARANKQKHVPYRNSTLTYLLQDSLEKDSKTLMLVQISPLKSNAEESFCSLNFAHRAKQVQIPNKQPSKQ